MENKIEKQTASLTRRTDSFVFMNQKLDIELATLRLKSERLEEQLHTVMKHLQLEIP